MVEINLLPWRSTLKQYQQKQLRYMLLLTFIVILSLLWGMREYGLHEEKQLTARIKHLKQRIHYLQSQSSRPTKKVSKQMSDHLTFRKQQLRMEALWIAVGNLKTKDVCFTKLTSHQGALHVAGQARSAMVLTTFLTHWPDPPLFTSIKLTAMQQRAQVIHFEAYAYAI